jgi:hypothetical protein
MSDNDELLQIINSHMIFEVHPSLILAVSHCDGIDDLTMGQLLGVVSTVNKDVHEQALGIANDICRTLREFKYDGAPIREDLQDATKMREPMAMSELAIEVQALRERIKELECLLTTNGIQVPE